MSAIMPDGNTAALRTFEREEAEYERRVDAYVDECSDTMDGRDTGEIRGLVEMLECADELAGLIVLMNGPVDLETKKAAIWDRLQDIKGRAVTEQVECCKRNGVL